MVVGAIVAAEIGFWLLIAAGLATRYVAGRRRLGAALLAATPLVDLALLIVSVADLRGGATASAPHALAAVYVGVSVAFGHRLVRWADVRVAHRFAGGPAPERAPRFGAARARHERQGWYRHVLAWAIGCGLLLAAVVAVGDPDRTGALLGTIRAWSVVLGIDFLISVSYTVFPRSGGTAASARSVTSSSNLAVGSSSAAPNRSRNWPSR